LGRRWERDNLSDSEDSANEDCDNDQAQLTVCVQEYQLCTIGIHTVYLICPNRNQTWPLFPPKGLDLASI
jgi:hypothetical protein